MDSSSARLVAVLRPSSHTVGLAESYRPFHIDLEKSALTQKAFDTLAILDARKGKVAAIAWLA